MCDKTSLEIWDFVHYFWSLSFCCVIDKLFPVVSREIRNLMVNLSSYLEVSTGFWLPVLCTNCPQPWQVFWLLVLLKIEHHWLILHCFTVLRYSQQTQTDAYLSGQHRQPKSATLNIPKLSISVEDTGPKGKVVFFHHYFQWYSYLEWLKYKTAKPLLYTVYRTRNQKTGVFVSLNAPERITLHRHMTVWWQL